MRRTCCLLPALLLLGQAALADVLSYCAAEDKSFEWSVLDESKPNQSVLAMTSQTWQGIPWKHSIAVFHPTGAALKHPDLCVLMITGGRYSPGQDELKYGAMLANAVGAPLAVLWDIPNQPLYGGLHEDGLIAYSFQKAIETKDDTWPLLFPMTKSAVRAMDALQDYSEQKWGARITRFVTTGASKRGWTTWFTGAVDPRVCGIIPMVYDNLNIPVQMKHQIDIWGHYSPEIDDYTKLGLQDKLGGEAQALGALVDPYTYRDRITMPKLIVNGTNDAYWTVDSLNLYRGDLKGETYQIYIPNAGHGLGGDEGALNAGILKVLGACAGFIRLLADEQPRPALDWKQTVEDGQVVLTLTAPAATRASAWTALADRGEFTDATWAETRLVKEGDAYVGRFPLPDTGYLGCFGEASFPGVSLPLPLPMPLSTTLQLSKR
ncbi:MAG: phenylacetic acid degradation protein [Armatimonadetes bacterium]|nr:phenylacetic acid degradation protein [Armatimonadota bacterium]